MIAAAAIWGSVVNSTTAIWRDANPERVLRVDPDNGVAMASLAQYALAGENFVRPDVQRVAVERARAAIAAQPLNPAALVVLASGRAPELGPKRVYPMFRTADAMTRRSAVTQLWLIEYEASADRADRVLFHYDATLRVQPQTGEVLFPIMANALEDRRLWPSFISFFQKPPPWFEGFFRQAVATPAALIPLARMAGGPGRLPDGPINRALESELLGALATSKNYGETRRFYATLRNARATDMTSTGFTSRDIDMSRSPFAWQPIVTGNLSAGFEEGDKGGFVLRVSAARNTAGEAARRTVMLSPGRYMLDTRADVDAPSPGRSAYWLIECATTGAALGELQIIGRGALPGARAFEVGPNCPAQNLRLIIDSGSEGGLDLTVRRIGIVARGPSASQP